MSYKVKLFVPKSYLDSTQEDISHMCNGCGPKGFFGKLVPNKILGLNFTTVCNIHDFMYVNGSNNSDYRKMADGIFWLNLILIHNDYESRTNDIAIKRFVKRCFTRTTIYAYYLLVAKFGKLAYNGNGNDTIDNIEIAFEKIIL